MHALPEAFGGTAPNDRISPWLTEEVKRWQDKDKDKGDKVKDSDMSDKDKGGDDKGKEKSDKDTLSDKLPHTSKLP